MTAQTATEAPVDAEAIQAFAAGVRGPVLGPDDAAYDEARRIWNGLIDRRTTLIVQAQYDPANLFRMNLNIKPAS